MEKKLLGLVSTLLVINLGWDYSRHSQTSNDLKDLHNEFQALQSRLGTVESQLIQRRSENQSILISKIRRAQEAEQRSADQKTNNISDNPDNDSAEGSSDTPLAPLKERIEQQKKIVDGLAENLRQVRTQIAQLKKQRRQDQSTLQSEQKSLNDQYSTQISQTQQALDQLQTQMDTAKAAYGANQFDLTAAQTINDLRGQITSKITAIQSLKEQRANDNITKSAQRTTALSQSQQELDDLENNEQSIDDTLAHERETLLLLRIQDSSELAK